MSACCCTGPRPGHELCPCRERIEKGREASIVAKVLERMTRQRQR